MESTLDGCAPQDVREEIVRVVREMYHVRLITATGGNVSARISGKELWITPSRLFKGDLRAEVIVRMDLDGNTLDHNAPPPSSEWLLHTEIYKARPDVQAIIHAHAPYATMLGLSGKPFLPVTADVAFLGELPRVPFVMPGTLELARATVRALGAGAAAILQNHGLVVVAGSVRQAADRVEMIERAAQLILGCYAVGEKPLTLSEDVVELLRAGGGAAI